MAWYLDELYRPASKRERQGRAAWAAETLRAEGRELQPVELTATGTKIATTFWGKAWCDNIETYSDYENRLPRGRSYVRSGTVIDLRIEPGKVRALVHGSELYDVAIDVQPLKPERWQALVKQSSGQIDSVVSLLGGQLSESVLEALCDRERGLFPKPSELSLSCSCPDRAGLCKHLAAVLYGIGARLDHHPELFFVLRGVEKMDLVSQAGATEGADELAGVDLAEIFGIELATGTRKKRRPKPAKRRRR